MLDLDETLALTAGGDLQLISGDDALAQRVRSRTNTQQGEWSYDTAYGLPWMFSILGERADSAGTRALLASRLLLDPEVEAVDRIEFEFNRTARTASISVSVRSTSGSLVSV